MIVQDQMGRAVHVPEQPQRIISLVSPQTELLFDLGLDAEIVGVTTFCRHPIDKVGSKTDIGRPEKFRFNVINMLKPDLILGDKEEICQEDIDRLAEKYPVWMSDVHTLPEALAMIRAVGELVGKKEIAVRLTGKIAIEFAAMPQATRPYRTAYLIWERPLTAVGNNTFIHDTLNRTGLVNVFAGFDRYPQLTLAQLQAVNPELLLLSSGPNGFGRKHLTPFFIQFPDTKIKLVDGEMFSWYGSRLLPAATYLRKFLQTLAADG